jgi:8-oxo-dGTP pyrophosphatase MutT (NUDIX family)
VVEPKNDLSNKLRDTIDDSFYQSNKNDRSGIYFFISFDLVNATEYKIRNHEWHSTFKDFYIDISKKITHEDSPINKAKNWKFIGDEVLFYLKVNNINEIFESLPFINKTVKSIEKSLSKESHYFDKLYVKTTAWIADVIDENFLEKNKEKFKATNIIFSPLNKNSKIFQEVDFLGFEVDLGFRISKHSHHNVIALDAKLAYLLYQNRQEIKESEVFDVEKNIKIVSYENLKGIWRSHHYPIIWYCENWSVENIFTYDEHLNNTKIDKLKDYIENPNKSNEHSLNKLNKILKDVNQFSDIQNIRNNIKSSIECESVEIEINIDKVSEVHVALICFNSDKTKILSALRPKDKKRFPDTWEFGCGQVSLGETFEQTAIRTYKEDFNINIEVLNDSLPIAIYSFEDSSNKVIPGMILIGQIKDSQNIKQNKYEKIRWITIEDIKSIDNNLNKYVKKFKENALKAFEFIKQNNN